MTVAGTRILLIQDNYRYVDATRDRLEKEGPGQFIVDSAISLAKGKKKISKGGIDLILLELALPDSAGLSSFLEIRDAAPFTPIIILTGLDDEMTALQAIQRGAQDYILKVQIHTAGFARLLRYAIARHRLRLQLMNLSLKDELTSLYNRRGFFLLAEQHMKFATNSKQQFLLMLFDVDGLKGINDKYGHLYGDHALVSAADLLRQTFRKSDVLARIGGDEFAAIAMDASGENATAIEERFKNHLRSLNQAHAYPFGVSISLGFYEFNPAAAMSLESLMSAADVSLYDSKPFRKVV